VEKSYLQNVHDRQHAVLPCSRSSHHRSPKTGSAELCHPTCRDPGTHPCLMISASHLNASKFPMLCCCPRSAPVLPATVFG
jgi:hypothetical protein